MKAVVLLTICALALAGCGGKDDLSKAQMEAHVDAAIAALAGDLGPGGAISGADIVVPVEIDDLTIQVKVIMAIGPPGDILLTTSVGLLKNKAYAWVYCNEERMVLVTDGLPKLDASLSDYSAEMRNLRGSCLEFDDATAELLGGFHGIEDLVSDRGSLEQTGIKQTAKKTIEVTYFDHAKDTTITLLVVDKRLELATADAGEGELKVDFLYGERSPVEAPPAAIKVPAPVVWKGTATDAHYVLRIEQGETPLDDVVVRVYEKGATVPCRAGPTPKAAFALRDGWSQNKAGIRFDFVDDGDDVLGAGDQAILQKAPNSVWNEQVEIWDTWSGSSAHPACGIAAPGAWGVAAGLLVAVAARRR